MTRIPPEAEGDPFHPPEIPTEVGCLHCQQTYDSHLIWWDSFSEERRKESDMPGIWRCPTPGCDGVGFGFDIWPTDPDYVDPESGEKMCLECDEEQEWDEEDDPEQDPDIASAIEHDMNIINEKFDAEVWTFGDEAEGDEDGDRIV